MAINAYVGLQGSGKTFEVVSSVIVPALAKGRRVVTNIGGINKELIAKYIEQELKVDPDKIGELIAVKNEDVVQSEFFPDEQMPDMPSVVQGGDLVCIDEVWQFWGAGGKIGANAMQFMRMHRHYVDKDSGGTCDIALMIQDLTSLHRSIRAVVELTVKMTKLKNLGFTSKYRVELYEGGRVTKAARFDYHLKNYNKKIFPLYQSYAGGAGKEAQMDSRQNIWMNKKLWFIFGIGILASIFTVNQILKFFSGKTVAGKGSSVSVEASKAAGDIPAIKLPVKPSQPELSKTYRLAGTFKASGEVWAVLVDNDGRMRLESPSQFNGKGMVAAGLIDGERVTTFTGQVKLEQKKNDASIRGEAK